MIPLTLDSLFSLLTDNQFDVKRQPETQQLYILLKTQEQDYPIFCA